MKPYAYFLAGALCLLASLAAGAASVYFHWISMLYTVPANLVLGWAAGYFAGRGAYYRSILIAQEAARQYEEAEGNLDAKH